MSDSDNNRKSASNTVILMVGDSIVGRFEPKLSEENKMTPAMRQAKSFLEAVVADEDHELHADLMGGRLEVMNSEIKVFGPKQKTVFTLD